MGRIGSRLVFAALLISAAACVPPPVPEAQPTAISAGGWHSCVLESDNTTSCWGWSSFNQLGSPGDVVRPVPARVRLGGLTAISAGGTSTCAIDGNANVRCWGAYSVFGGAAPVDREVVNGVSDVVQLASGIGFHCALQLGGSVSCWGVNDEGQLGSAAGMGDLAATSNSGAVVAGLPPVSAIAAGDSHACALAAGGTVWCWGFNESGQLGTDPAVEGADSRFSPVEVPGLADVAALAAGSFHTCALGTDDSVRCWGDNFFGQLGTATGVETNDAHPVPVTALSGAEALAAGGSTTCTVASGVATCWGGTFFGQSGSAPVPGTDSQPAPGAVSGLPPVASVSVGLSHTCALDVDANIWCWGGGNFGQSGQSPNLGQPGPNHVPVAVPVP